MKHHDQKQLWMKGYIPHQSISLKEVRTGPQAETETEAKGTGGVAYSLDPCYQLSLLSYRAQDHPSRGGLTNNMLLSSTSIIQLVKAL